MPVYFAYYAGIMLDGFGYLQYYALNYASIIGLGLASIPQVYSIKSD